MIPRVQRTFWWPGVSSRSEIKNLVRTCLSSQRSKRVSGELTGLLQPLHTPHGLWDCVSSKLVTSLLYTRAGLDTNSVFVDRPP